VHPDVPDGIHALRAAGRRQVTLTNGSTQVYERLLIDAGIRDEFEALLSVEDAGIWKPARGAYE
jgi:2-haloacid dehalogenase